MKFAVINGEKSEAQPSLRGTCAHCQSDTIAKCGDQRIRYWAHKSKIPCDSWWENETEWHRAWKNRFRTEWQEKIHSDPIAGEKHIADIKTDKEFVIEFQHSAIKPSELKSREDFYKNMVWVVDGTRLKRDYPRFCKGFSDLMRTVKFFFLSVFPNECFPASWLKSSVPVYFDFQGSNPADQQDKKLSLLWCLFPNRVEGYAVVAGVPPEEFIKLASTDSHLLSARGNLSYISEYIRLQRESAAAHARREYSNAASRQYARRHFRL